jgi:hypothetical protein
MARLALLSFRDVVVAPYTDLIDSPYGHYHRGGPKWPDWEHQTAARQCRYGKPDDTEPAEAEQTATLEGPLAWGGAITPLFGYQVADFSTRLLPTLDEKPDARFAYSMRENFRDQFREWEGTPAFFRDLLEWYGIGRDRVELIAEPTLVELLDVAPQAEQFYGPGPEPWYLDLLDAHLKAKLGDVERARSLYVSRADQRAGFAGESYLEEVFAQVGFRVLRPETVSIGDQVRAYLEAESLVFAGGSALHGVQLIGHGLGDVTVLCRRQRRRPAEVPLTARARSLRYIDAVRGVVHGLSAQGAPLDSRGLTILDPERLRGALPLGEAWDGNTFAEAVEADVKAWLKEEQESGSWEVPGSPERVADSLRAAGLEQLVPV